MKKKSIIIFMILITIINTILPVANAAQIISKANLKRGRSINTHLQFKHQDGTWHKIQCRYIYYEVDGASYPAYCIKHGVNGVDEEGPYTVTINDLLKDKLIYNTILNGYPYRTPNQLGLETAEEAYVATKHAINSVLLGRNVRTFYKAADTKGKDIIDAIYDISEKGKAGNEINKTASVTASKIGNLTEKGEYYYQEYSVSADVNISDYNIESLKGFSSSCFTTDTNGTKKNEFSSGQHFRVMIPKKDLKQDIVGTINIVAQCNTKPIFYGEAPRGNIQNYAVTYKPYVQYEKAISFNEKTNTASIRIIKKDKETEKPIKDVSFSLYNENGEYITTAKTNENGIVIFHNLYQGKYKIKETKSAENYVKDDTTYEINTIYNQQVTEIISNVHKKGNLKITKVDKDNPDVTLGGIEFDLLDENKKIIAHLTTDADGEAEIKNINIGKYTLKETKTKREYNLCENENILVEWNKTLEIVIANEKKKGQIKVIKHDEDRSEIKLEGVKFQVLDKNDKVVEEIITDSKGEAITSRLPVGEYKIKEYDLGNNNTYLLNEKSYEAEIKDNEIIEMQIQNKHKKGSLKIYKVDKDNEKVALEGVKFEITDKDGFQYNAITNQNGIAEVDNIRIGEVTIREVETNKEYVLSTENYTLEIEHNQCANITIKNEKKKGQVEVYKTDKENKKIKIPGVEFLILDKNNQVIDKLITDANGYAISKKIPIGEYYLKETKTNSKYILREEILKIAIQENKVLKIEIENQKIKGRIEIIKTSSKDSPILNIKKGEPLSDVIFDIYNEKGELVDTVSTDEKGQAISKDLEIGRYKVIEKSTNQYYLLNTNEFLVNIDKNNETKILNIENEPMIPLVKIEKQGKQYAEKNEEIKYEFDIKNKSNSDLDEFTWKEYIPYKDTKITKIMTGIYSENLDYQIYYKTNQNDYRLFKEANTCNIEYLSFDNLNLQKNEIITEIKVEFGTVSKDFKSVINPCIFVKINDNKKKGDIITNITEISGKIEEYEVKDKSSFETIIQEKEILKKLPKTGC